MATHRNIFLLATLLFSFFEYALSQDYFEQFEFRNPKTPPGISASSAYQFQKKLSAAKQDLALLHMQNVKPQQAQYKNIPSQFEITATNPKPDFVKMLSNIQNMANKQNLTLQYKVKVEVNKATLKKPKKPSSKKFKSKKYNVPLKKKNMRLSSFELIMRKLADNAGQRANVVNPVLTTDFAATHEPITTTKVPVLKYKPIISRTKIKFAKKPVKAVKTNEYIIKTSK